MLPPLFFGPCSTGRASYRAATAFSPAPRSCPQPRPGDRRGRRLLGCLLGASFAWLADATGATPTPAVPSVSDTEVNLYRSIPDKEDEVLPPEATITGRVEAPDAPLAWWYRAPAEKFWEGMPIGTGRFAAMVYGRVRDEVIPFNDETLWTGQPYNPANPEGLKVLPEVRRLALAGQFAEAAELAAKLLSHPVPFVQTYQAMGRLQVQFDGHDAVQDYRRELDLDQAIVRVSYRIGEARYTREVFASYPDQVVVMRLSCDRPGGLSLRTRLSSLHPSATQRALGADTIAIEGGVSQPTPEFPSLMRWQGRVQVRAEGGTVRTEPLPATGGVGVRVERAQAVTIILAGATNYVTWDRLGDDPGASCARELRAVARRSYAELRQRHLADYQPLFRACQLDVGTNAAAREDTTTRLQRLRAGGDDPQFSALYFQYGRYLLLAGSRPGTLAFNNHNIWLDDLKGRWRGRWTLNINLQECYWPAENANLPSTVDALGTFLDNLAASGRRTAREVYGARGWCAHHGTDIWMNTAMTDRVYHGIAPMMGLWMMQSLWEHYLFDPQPGYLARIYPLLKGAAEFARDFLVAEPKHGWLVTCPSGSPENSFLLADGKTKSALSVGPALDTQLVRDVFTQCIAAAEKLGVDAAWRAELAAILPRLAPHQIRANGALQEWLEDYPESDPKHRHVSHLYAAYPSHQITRRGTPELAEAVRKTLVNRGEKGGWSAAWKINLYARLGDAEAAYHLARKMETEISLHPAKEDSDKVPSLEGNQGIQAYTAGLVELLLQSHAGEIELLPALPQAWAQGSAQGLRARGGYTVDLAWAHGRLARATLHAKYAGPCRVRAAGASTLQRDGQPITKREIAPDVWEFDAAAGGTYTLTATR